ncbi:MFS transporter [Nocardioides dongxiaopingii]|uniref:MFS transporter n=1 Tax=Nocardioides dongxiaopingii TaxID=2576036 RepID=UPI0010C77092|nr:MFS transporter [Nocardioides dongxiaopingii]
MSSLVELVVPARLGAGFRWVLASSWTTNLGDGIALAAGPLLVASQTDQPFLVALAALAVWAPPLVFGLHAGAITDRLDRRLIVLVTNALRVAVLVVLTTFILTDAVSIAVVLVAMFTLGTAEMFADNAASTLVPMLVARDDLAVANSRIQTGLITVNQLAGPPLGAALFAAGSAWPFAAEAVLVLLGALLVVRLELPPHRRDPATVARISHDIAEGFRWVVHHAAVRTLVLTIFIFNITFGAAWSVLVLYATQRLGLGEVGFGLVTTVGAAGGLLGTLSYGWVTRHVSLGNLMRVGLVVETLTHLGLALTTSPYVALPIFFVFGAHAFIWGTTSITVRQRAVPSSLQGRVGSVNLVGVYGGLVVGSGVGGLLAQHGGLAAPFWFAFAGSAVFVVAIWRQLSHVAHADEAPVLPTAPSADVQEAGGG